MILIHAVRHGSRSVVASRSCARLLLAIGRFGVAVAMLALDAAGQSVTSPPPANVVFVAHPSGYYLTKHPTLPMLYLGGYYAAESKNLITFQLASDGTVNTNSLRTFNYFSENPTNDQWRYMVQRPIVLTEEKILYLAAVPSGPQFFAHTNHQEIAAVALDDEGQPGQVLKAIRTSHGEKEIRGWEFDPTTHRLYMSYHSYFGWIPVGKDGLPASDHFRLMHYVQTCWQWVFVPQWQRFFARQTDGGLVVFRLSADGSNTEWCQLFTGPYRGSYSLGVNPTLRRLYFLDTTGKRLVVKRLTADGRVTGLPRFLPVGEVWGARYHFPAKRLYTWHDKSVLKSYPLDEHGDPVDKPDIFALNCGTIRDLMVDETTGKLYVACTEWPAAP
jgi:hypothetical protein